MIAIDVSRTTVSWRASRRYRSAALASNALHFGGDLAGSVAVLVGLLIARAGYPNGDSVAALFVAVLVLLAAARLIRSNIDVLMDRAPADAEEAARAAIARADAGGRAAPAAHAPGRRPPVRGRRDRRLVDATRSRQGHAAADAVEQARRAGAAGQRRRRPRRAARRPGRPRARARGGADRARACARSTTSRSSHVDGRLELSLHLKLPGDVTLEEAHDVAEQLERAILDAAPELDAVQTHLEPLTEPSEASEESVDSARGRAHRARGDRAARRASCASSAPTSASSRSSRSASTARASLDDAHARASEIEELIRREQPEIADVIVHTEP